MTEKRKIGILGYGNTGKFLTDKILNSLKVAKHFELIFVWNRSEDNLTKANLPNTIRLSGNLNTHINSEAFNQVDLIVEVCHPDIIHQYGKALLDKADLFIASVTAMANYQTEDILKKKLHNIDNNHSIFLPAGAAWGIHDIQKMAQLNTISDLKITMKFNADALKLNPPLQQKLDSYINDSSNTHELNLYEGAVRPLAVLAPNNVNTMTCLALAAHTIGLDKTKARLIAHKATDAHLVEIEASGKNGFKVKTQRFNPAKKGAVTGNETYYSFLASLLNATASKKGMHFC